MNNIFKLNLTELQRAELKSEFDQLETIEEKIDFWNDKLRVDFCFFDQCLGEEINDFWIEAQTEDEFEFINNRNLNTYKEKLEFIKGENAEISFEKLEEAFLAKIETVKNKDFYIDEEIKKINSIIEQKEIELTQDPFSSSRFFVASHRQYLINDIEPMWNKAICETRNLYESDKGITTAKYKELLEDYRTHLKTGIQKIPRFTHDQQMFILDYLQVNNNLDNVKRGLLYARILNRDPETTRQRFSSLEKNKTVKNLSPILSLFTELGLVDQVQMVEKDLISKKRKEEINKGKRM